MIRWCTSRHDVTVPEWINVPVVMDYLGLGSREGQTKNQYCVTSRVEENMPRNQVRRQDGRIHMQSCYLGTWYPWHTTYEKCDSTTAVCMCSKSSSSYHDTKKYAVHHMTYYMVFSTAWFSEYYSFLSVSHLPWCWRDVVWFTSTCTCTGIKYKFFVRVLCKCLNQPFLAFRVTVYHVHGGTFRLYAYVYKYRGRPCFKFPPRFGFVSRIRVDNFHNTVHVHGVLHFKSNLFDPRVEKVG